VYYRKKFHIWNATLNVAAVASHGDINITRQIMRFLVLYFIGRTYRTALQQVLEMFETFSTLYGVSCYFAKCFRVSGGISMFSIVLQFLLASLVIRIHFLFEISQQKEV
jgi:hypothetical protein